MRGRGLKNPIEELISLTGPGNRIELILDRGKVTVATFTMFGGIKEVTACETHGTWEGAARACAKRLKEETECQRKKIA